MQPGSRGGQRGRWHRALSFLSLIVQRFMSGFQMHPIYSAEGPIPLNIHFCKTDHLKIITLRLLVRLV
jgi:hypothetical protein